MTPDGEDHPATGRHRLGPHVVGQRVVLRRLVRESAGSSGGPRMTDLLGTCVAWTAGPQGAAVVDRDPGRDGTPGERVVVPLADIVSGKPVPPRPSIRHRVTAREAELHGLAQWPWLETEPLGEWVLRCDPDPDGNAGRLVKRANSCLSMGSPGLPPAEAVAAVDAFYRDRDRTPLAQVEPGGRAEAAYLSAGWEPLGAGDSRFLVASVAQARRARRGAAPPGRPVEVREDGDRLLAAVDGVPPGAPGWVGSGRAARSGDWLGLHGLEVAGPHRRQGLGLALVDALLERGAETGCTTAWLHVEDDNPAGLALYSALGFLTHHRCRYLTRR